MRSQTLGRCCFIVALATLGQLVLADQDVVSDDGREVRLHDDGTWSLLSRDRFATTQDGRRIKLMPNGQWVEVTQSTDGGVAVSTAVPTSASTSTSTSTSTSAKRLPVNELGGGAGILLTRVDVLKKKTKTHKSHKVDTRMAYHLQITNPGDQAIVLNQQLATAMQAADSKGRKYTTLSLRYEGDQIAAGASKQVVVLIDGAPRWYGVQFLSLEIAPDTFGGNRRMVLSKNMNDVTTLVVEEF